MGVRARYSGIRVPGFLITSHNHMISSDSYYCMGSTHEVCQDYALSYISEEGKALAVVCDGCSGSDDTDVGSRVLAHQAKRLYRDTGDLPISTLLAWFTSDTLRSLGVHQHAADCTFLSAEYKGPSDIRVTMNGDGVMVARRRDTGDLMVDILEFPGGYPYYINYLVDPERLKGYLDLTGGCWSRTSYWVYSDGADGVEKFDSKSGEGRQELSGDAVFSLNSRVFDFVFLMSDGAHTFEGLSVFDVAREMAAVPNFKGKFMTRRVKRFLKKSGSRPEDDFSVAALYVSDDEVSASEHA